MGTRDWGLGTGEERKNLPRRNTKEEGKGKKEKRKIEEVELS